MTLAAITSEEIRHIAEAAAQQAIRELMLTMGIDATDPKAMLEMQRDFAHVRRWRQSVETVQTRGLIVATGIIVSGVLGLIWMAIAGKH